MKITVRLHCDTDRVGISKGSDSIGASAYCPTDRSKEEME